MAALEKIVERIPYSDGGFRRRMTAGAIVVLGAAFSQSLKIQALSISFKDASELINSTFVGIILLLLVYAIGGLVEVLAELFVSRLTGNTAWAIIAPKNMYKKYPSFIRKIFQAFTYYPGIIFLLYAAWGRAIIGKSSYRWHDLEKTLQPNTRAHYKLYPDIIKKGLEDPFGVYGELAWRYFSNHGTHEEMSFARKLENRNKDILVIVTSLMIVMTIFIPSFQRLLITPGAEQEVLFIFMQFMMVVPVVFLSSYFLLLKQSILSVIEYRYMGDANSGDEKNMHNKAN